MRRLLQLLCGFIALSFVSGCFGPKTEKTYSIYRGTGWQGVNLHGTEKNVIGFTDDLFMEIAKQKQVKVNFVSVSTHRTLTLLNKENVDAVLTTQTVSPKDEKLYQFSDPFFSFGPVLILRSKDSLERFKALKVKAVGFSRGLDEDLMTREDLGYIFRPYEQVVDGIDELIAGRIDAFIVDSIYGYQLAGGIYAGQIQVATPLFKAVQFRLAVKAGENQELITLVNQGLKELRDNGLYQKMLEYWGLHEQGGQ